MSKRVALVAGIVLLSLPSVVAAKDDMEPRMQAVLACEAISANEARLQCFDQAILPLEAGHVPRRAWCSRRKKDRSRLNGVVKASGKSGASRYWILLDNGERWSIATAKDRRDAPTPGTALRMKTNVLSEITGSPDPGWPKARARSPLRCRDGAVNPHALSWYCLIRS